MYQSVIANRVRNSFGLAANGSGGYLERECTVAKGAREAGQGWLGRMLRLPAFEPFDALVQVEGAFQSVDLRQDLTMAGASDLCERRKTAPDRVKAGIHILFDSVQADMHGSQFGRQKILENLSDVFDHAHRSTIVPLAGKPLRTNN